VASTEFTNQYAPSLDAVRELAQRIAVVHPNGYRSYKPSAEQLERVLIASFWASLHTEEGRLTQVSLALERPEECSQLIRFAEPQTLSAETIRRLAPAFHSDMCALGVDDHSMVWGVATILPRRSAIITIVGPGHLLLRIEDDVIGAIRFDQATIPMRPLQDILRDAVGGIVDDKGIAFLLDLSAAMRQIGHGGAVAMVVDGNNVQGLARLYSLDPKFTAHADLRARNTHAARTLESDPQDAQARRDVQEEERASTLEMHRLRTIIAQLTAVDGIIVVTSDSVVLEFGSKIDLVKLPAQIETMSVGGAADWTTLDRLEELGGTRHQSAARLAGANPGVVVLVVSQDGKTSLFANHEPGGVRIVRDIDRFVPLDRGVLRFGGGV
jgi:hypothetical protein